MITERSLSSCAVEHDCRLPCLAIDCSQNCVVLPRYLLPCELFNDSCSRGRTGFTKLGRVLQGPGDWVSVRLRAVVIHKEAFLARQGFSVVRNVAHNWRGAARHCLQDCCWKAFKTRRKNVHPSSLVLFDKLGGGGDVPNHRRATLEMQIPNRPSQG